MDLVRIVIAIFLLPHCILVQVGIGHAIFKWDHRRRDGV